MSRTRIASLAPILSIADALVPAVAGVIGAIIGGGVVWMVERQRLDREQHAAARVLMVDLLDSSITIEEWLRKDHWWLTREAIAPVSWAETRSTLSGALTKDEWLELANDVVFLRSIERWWEDDHDLMGGLAPDARDALSDAVRRIAMGDATRLGWLDARPRSIGILHRFDSGRRLSRHG